MACCGALTVLIRSRTSEIMTCSALAIPDESFNFREEI